MVEEIVLCGALHAIIVRRTFHEPGAHFFTPHHFSQQLGYMSHPAGHRISPHGHRSVRREAQHTQEVLLVREGKLRVDFYDDGGTPATSRTLDRGDVILLVSGGHGFEVLEPCQIIAVKQGPYVPEEDKVPLLATNGPDGSP